MTGEVLVETDSGVMVIRINRPQVRNAISRAVANDIARALEELDTRADLRVGIITGNGGTFSAGMDLVAYLQGELPTVPGRGFAGITVLPPATPMIAAVEGHALAGGLEIVLACGLVVAGRSARFGLPEVKRGLVAAAGGLLRLPDKIPMAVAMQLALTGDPVDAGRAYALGLVSELVDDGSALDSALLLAHRIAANAPLATTATKRVLRESRGWARDERFARQDEAIRAVVDSDDAAEGARAFAEKRAPRWAGR